MDLTTNYLGLTLKSPLVASASPLNAHLDNLKALQDYGAGAVVLPSIFEEQIVQEQEVLDALIDSNSESSGEALSYFPTLSSYAFDTTRQITLIEQAVASLDIPVIASLNGIHTSGWVNFARDIEAAGAHAIELNIFFVPSDPTISGQEVEQRYIDIVKAVTSVVSIPVSVKIGPYFSSLGSMASELVKAGAKGLVMFNRFYQPDINTQKLSIEPSLELSTSFEMRLPLLWIGILAGRTNASLAATTGVETHEDVVKYLLAGADVVMTTSSLLRHGLEHMKVLSDGLVDWLDARDLTSLDIMRGKLSHICIANPESYERANYIKVLQNHGRA
ncbi:dihydroorotate dehydrogenase-like protein [Cohaesibacter celericrescens]|uniref:Dihydroorotate dehydrogenase n=1 Tax=Cohaesibacter celericrescens TaxID=2067669 RepID=A0A2N5XTJ0_9HYPH|nr:dihydroorotate dehydrogenase-like protein [Cohaesibacter celericrescens]PLW77824.1 dihydroorotate dehydrogenase [Cohaesibacter celericrescens]